jgi:23S rRNA pseudouridine2457 synthase
MPTHLLFNKPYEVLCQFSPSAGKRTLKDYIPIAGVYPAGRLDYRSEGLVLLSDDGGLIHRLTDPRYDHPKTYYAQVEGEVSAQQAAAWSGVILLPGIQGKPARMDVISDPGLPPRPTPVRGYHPTTWLKIVLCEGKNHQVRRMTASAGYPTLRLVRVAIGGLTLDGLHPGEWRQVSSEAILRGSPEVHR